MTSVRTRGAGIAEAVEVHVVQVSVLVRDDEGAFVKGLEARDFRLREDGVPQRLAHVANQDTPLEIVVALDIGAGMAGAIDDVRCSARTFISALRERDALTILGFNDNIFTVARRETQAETRLRARSPGAVGIDVALRRDQPRRLAVAPAGRPQGPRRVQRRGGRVEPALVRRRREGAAVEQRGHVATVGLGRGARMADLTRQLSRLADASGGRAVIAPDPSELSGAFRDVVDELAHQYVLSYAPTNEKRDGTWRALTVEVPGRDVCVRARQGYRATGTKP